MGLSERIESREAIVSVIGLGYVGLPLAVALAEGGFRVIGIDANTSRVDAVNQGDSYIADIPSERLSHLTRRLAGISNGQVLPPPSQPGGSLEATSEYTIISESDAVIICVPTPLSKTKDPDLSYISAAIEEIARWLRPETLVVLESTTYPGTTEEVVLPRLQHCNGRKFEVGEDFYLAFSPERIDPGNQEWSITNTPKVVGGITPRCLAMAESLYRCITQEVVPVSSPKVAEMVKLLENTFRATNIALVNEIAIMCNRLGVDVWEVVEAAKTKPFGYMAFYPGPGLGGHCLPVDPQYLAWKLKTLDYQARFIELAAEVNFGMPGYVAQRVGEALATQSKQIKGTRLLVLGVAYKADVADIRESPALDLIQLLRDEGAEVAYHDPYIPHISFDDFSMDSVELDLDTMRQFDCVVITTAHGCFDWDWIVENSRLVVDTRNATQGITATAGRVVKL